MTTTRLRRSVGIGWRKMLFQTCVSVNLSRRAMVVPWWRASLWGPGGGMGPGPRQVGREAASPGPRPAGAPPDRRSAGVLGGIPGQSDRDEAVRVGPLAHLLLELLALVDQDLA